MNLDFADVKAIMSNQGLALMGTGRAAGPRKAVESARAAVTSPLLDDVEIDGATGVLINITGGLDMSLQEVNEACTAIREAAHPDANIIFGAVIDERMKDEFKITVVATGFDKTAQTRRENIARGTPQGALGRRRRGRGRVRHPHLPPQGGRREQPVGGS